jgi:hypothetical protein
MGGGAGVLKGVVGLAEGGGVDGMVVRADKGAGRDVTVDRDLVIVKRGRRRANNMTEDGESQSCGRLRLCRLCRLAELLYLEPVAVRHGHLESAWAKPASSVCFRC